ncbi:MAG: LysM peptidoglycan-binding domain-containing protein [Dehalococcoidia bacterium]|nr:LysM peptidoglycan-binding domain-containing protein [Dehalococcoidia bacterium]
MSWIRRSTSRRRFLAGAAAIPAALALGSRPALATGSAPLPAHPSTNRPAAGLYAPRHLAWVWQFQHDGERELIRDVLSTHKLGLAIKTHDGTDWMSKYDPTTEAIDGPASIEALASYFAEAGVPLHTWSVLHGLDPEGEAQMAAETLDAGAQSVFLDLEPHSGFWKGTNEDALRFGEELRRLQPTAFVSTSVDARPWELPNIPMAEFAQFTDAVAPQVYWSAFDTPANLRKYTEAGDDPGDEGMTPRFAMNSAARHLEQFGLPIHPIGDGTVDDNGQWSEFIEEAFASKAEALSVWRFGVADTAVWELLRDTPPRPLVYTIQSGDTLYQLALDWDTTVDEIAATNGLTNVNYLFIGQELRIPRAGGGTAPTLTASPPAGSGSTGGTTYTVEPGDSLWSIAWNFDTTVDALAEANGITDITLIGIGDTLIIP